MSTFLFPLNSILLYNLCQDFFFMIYPLIQFCIMFISTLKSKTFQCLFQRNFGILSLSFPSCHIRNKVNVEMWSSFILMPIAAKYPKCRIPFLEIFYILIQYLYSQISFFCSSSHIFSVSNLENYFMEQLFLFSLPDFFIVICNLPIFSFPDIIPFYSFIKQFFIDFFQILILITNI